MKHLDLFSGIGGFALAARNVGWETTQFVEIDPYCQRVLAKNFPNVPIHSDIKDFDGQDCDIITAGFPCQPYSCAGKQLGEKDDRALWPHIVRVLARTRPTWFIGENVTGFVKLGLDQALSDLEDLSYTTRTLDIPACARSAPHTRRRIWIVAHTEWSKQPRQEPCNGEAGRVGREQQPLAWDRDWEGALREFRGMDDGLSYGVDRLDGLRNAIVPQVAEVIFRAIEELK